MENNTSLYKKGFTFLEVTIAAFIFSVIAAGVAAFSYYYLQSYAFSNEQNQQLSQAQLGLGIMMQEIRSARQSEHGAWAIIDPSNNSFSFYSDVTGDGRTDQVRYFLNGSNLQKGVIEPTTVPVSYPSQNEKITVIASNVDTSAGAIFTYYNGNWPTDTTNNPLSVANRLLNTRYVNVQLRININATSNSVKPLQLTGGVHIRSLKDNL